MAYEPKKHIEMAAKRPNAEEIVTQLRQVDVLNAQGNSMAEAIRSIGVTEVSYYRWRALIAWRRRIRTIFATLSRDMLKCFAA